MIKILTSCSAVPAAVGPPAAAPAGLTPNGLAAATGLVTPRKDMVSGYYFNPKAIMVASPADVERRGTMILTTYQPGDVARMVLGMVFWR